MIGKEATNWTQLWNFHLSECLAIYSHQFIATRGNSYIVFSFQQIYNWKTMHVWIFLEAK